MLQRGFTLTELLVVIVIAAILVGMAVPSMRSMLDSTKVKGSAESVLGGLRYARSEAIKRNAPMRFQLVTSLDASCAYSSTSPLWVVSQTDQVNYGAVAGACNTAPALPPDPCAASCVGGTGVYIAFLSNGITTNSSVVVAADNPVVTFGPLGQVICNMEASSSMQSVSFTSTDTGITPWTIKIGNGASCSSQSNSGSLKLCSGLTCS